MATLSVMMPAVLLAASLLVPSIGLAQEQAPAPAPAAARGTSADDLSKQLANPIASLVSVPIQMNWQFPFGPEKGTQFLMNIQPVIPIGVSEKWTMVARIITPVMGLPEFIAGGEGTIGLSDMTPSFTFTPSGGSIIWGVGAITLLPTATDEVLGTGKLGIGPQVVVMKQTGPWTIGALANHLVSVAGDSDRPDVNTTYINPFVTHSFAGGFSLTLLAEPTANWELNTDSWTTPVTVSASQVTRIQSQLFSVSIGAGYFVQRPESGPKWRVRMAVTLLFPK